MARALGIENLDFAICNLLLQLAKSLLLYEIHHLAHFRRIVFIFFFLIEAWWLRVFFARSRHLELLGPIKGRWCLNLATQGHDMKLDGVQALLHQVLVKLFELNHLRGEVKPSRLKVLDCLRKSEDFLLH